MGFEGAFANLAEFKARLSITDTVDDVDLLRILKDASGAMEAYVGRPLLRTHYVVETFDGGKDVIRVSTPPIAKIHWIRESEDRDFETAANYEELVEGDDYHLTGEGAAGRPGAGGGIKRIDQKWMGSRSASGQVRVAYTGGYKSDQEIVLEQGEVAISGEPGVPGCRAFGVSRYGGATRFASMLGAGDIALDGIAGENDIKYAVVSMRLSGAILPVWDIGTMLYGVRVKADSGAFLMRAKLINVDPLASTPVALFDAITDAENWGSSYSIGGSSYQLKQLSILTDSDREAMNDALRGDHLSLGFYIDTPSGTSGAVAGNGLDFYRPSMTVQHHVSFNDPFTVPRDLRGACIMQSVNNWQTRKHPGIITMSQRGVSIASGAALQKRPSELLPYVRSVCDRYRRV